MKKFKQHKISMMKLMKSKSIQRVSYKLYIIPNLIDI